MFGRRKGRPVRAYDKTGKIPAVRTSICTGEQVAGFKNESTGKFEEIMLIRDRTDLREFMRMYGVTESEIKYEY